MVKITKLCYRSFMTPWIRATQELSQFSLDFDAVWSHLLKRPFYGFWSIYIFHWWPQLIIKLQNVAVVIKSHVSEKKTVIPKFLILWSTEATNGKCKQTKIYRMVSWEDCYKPHHNQLRIGGVLGWPEFEVTPEKVFQILSFKVLQQQFVLYKKLRLKMENVYV